MSQNENKFRPPPWLVVRLPEMVIDQQRARRLETLRQKMCEVWGADNQKCSLAALQLQALDLLLSWEGALLTKIETQEEVQDVST